MAQSERTPDLTRYPATVLGRLIELIEEPEVRGTYRQKPDVKVYAGEFGAEDEIRRLTRRVNSGRVVYLVDFDDTFAQTSGTEGHTKGRHSCVVYACSSNRRGEAQQMVHALDAAHRCRVHVAGSEMPSRAGEHNNGFFRDEGVHRQFHIEGLSVYSFDTSVDLTEQRN